MYACVNSHWQGRVLTGGIVDHSQELDLLIESTWATADEDLIFAGVPASCRDI